MDHFLAQLKEFREDDKAQWKHAEKEMQRQARILQEAGGSDEQFKEDLKKAGINVAALEKEAKREAAHPRDLILNPALFANNPDNPDMTAGMTFLGKFLGGFIACARQTS